MVNTSLGPDAGLLDMLAARARATSDGRLVADVIGGLVTALTFALLHPTAWPIPFGAAVSLAAFGAYGVVDREITERSSGAGARWVPLLRFAKALVVAAGVFAAGVGCFSALALVLGTWIS